MSALAVNRFSAPRHHDHAAAILTSRPEVEAATRRVADLWRERGPQRDQDRAVPVDELEALGASGLLGIAVPVEHGGLGAPAELILQVFTELARADLALAQVPQNHFGTVYGLSQASKEQQEFFYAEVLRGVRFGNASAETGPGSRTKPSTTIRRVEGGASLQGAKRFCTGAYTADWIPVAAQDEGGRAVTVLVAQGSPGLTVDSSWDVFGQRATISGGARFESVFVPGEAVIWHEPGAGIGRAFRYSRSQLTHSALQLGAALGARDYGRQLAEHHSTTSTQQSDIQYWLDDLELRLAATAGLIGRAASLIDDITGTVEPSEAQVVGFGVAVDESKVLAYELGPWATNRLIGLSGKEFTAAHRGLDRLWRNARAHALHDPVRWRRHYVGNYYLTGTFQPTSHWLKDAPYGAQ